MADGFRLEPACRLRKRAAIVHIQQTGRRLHTRRFLIAYLSGGSDRSRLAVTVTRKVGSAVARNRIKRLVREYFRRHRDRFDAMDVVFIAKRGQPRPGYADVERDLAGVRLA